MTPQEWLAGYLEHGVQMPEMDAPDAVTADAARRLRVLLASPDLWREPPRGLLDQITASIGGERIARKQQNAKRLLPVHTADIRQQRWAGIYQRQLSRSMSRRTPWPKRRLNNGSQTSSGFCPFKSGPFPGSMTRKPRRSRPILAL